MAQWGEGYEDEGPSRASLTWDGWPEVVELAGHRFPYSLIRILLAEPSERGLYAEAGLFHSKERSCGRLLLALLFLCGMLPLAIAVGSASGRGRSSVHRSTARYLISPRSR